MIIEFVWSDAWLLTSIIYAQRDVNGATLRNIFYLGDCLNKLIFLNKELYSGFDKLFTANLIEFKDGKYYCKKWFLDIFDTKVKAKNHDAIYEVEQLLKEVIIETESISSTSFHTLNNEVIHKALKEYGKWFWKMVKTTKKPGN